MSLSGRADKMWVCEPSFLKRFLCVPELLYRGCTDTDCRLPSQISDPHRFWDKVWKYSFFFFFNHNLFILYSCQRTACWSLLFFRHVGRRDEAQATGHLCPLSHLTGWDLRIFLTCSQIFWCFWVFLNRSVEKHWDAHGEIHWSLYFILGFLAA